MEDKSLAARIAALAAESPLMDGEARILDMRLGGFEAVMNAIDETVLGARLTFSDGENGLTLLATGRRLAGLSAAEGIDVPEALIGADLTMDSPEQVKEVAQVVMSFAEGAETLNVTAVPMPEADDMESVSLSALMNAAGLQVDDPDASAMQRFMTRIQGSYDAAVLLENGAVSKTLGAITLVQSLKIALSTQLSTFLDARQSTCPSHTDPSMTLCQDTVEKGIGMAIAIHGDELTLLAFKSTELKSICAAWQRVT